MIFGPPHRKNLGVRSEVRESARAEKNFFFETKKFFRPRRENFRARKTKISKNPAGFRHFFFFAKKIAGF